MHSVELVLDDDIDRPIREEWNRLAAVGLPSRTRRRRGRNSIQGDGTEAARRQRSLVVQSSPSQARHTGASNRPHITLALAATLDAADGTRLTAATAVLPMPITIGGLLVFGSRRYVLARLVVPSVALLELQAAVVNSLAEPVDPHDTFCAGRWTPHVTLARRLTAEQLAEAVAALGEVSAIAGMAARARRWDMTAKLESWITG